MGAYLDILTIFSQIRADNTFFLVDKGGDNMERI